MRKIELLAPAANAEVAIEAILHGADAVYMGGPSHGARKNAANSIDDIRRVADFAHQFGARVYATVNTIVYDNELKSVERLIRDLYIAGTDALIVQDMGILRLDIPPIELHASTQCDTCTPEKARFLQDVGFSQIVLARELTLNEIGEICRSVSVPVECFVHGALCVSYSGRCHAGQATLSRSANRGECPQICRLPFTLTDAQGRVLERNRHLLSLKDFNASDRIEDMLRAGVSSFKIEGRLKEKEYVKNITAYYRNKIDAVIAANPELYQRASAGVSELSFTPRPDKSFNRGFTHYFLDERRPKNISSPLTPKSMGEVITDISQLHNGDGISFFNAKNEYEGVMVNGFSGNRIRGNRPFVIPKGSAIHRTLDSQWQKQLQRPTATRRLALDVTLSENALSAKDERGVDACVALNADIRPADNPRSIRDSFDKFGNTIYYLRDFKLDIPYQPFIPASQLSDARRRLIDALQSASQASYPFAKRRPEIKDAIYPEQTLDYQTNVSNRLAKEFYRSHGVKEIAPAMEIEKRGEHLKKGRSVMTTRHCILRERGCCLKENPKALKNCKFPLHITSGNIRFTLDFDCSRCEMHLLTE